MIRYFNFQFRLRKLFRYQEKTRKIYAKRLADLKKNKASYNEIQDLYHFEQTDMKIIEFEIERLTTSYFVRLAKIKLLETPAWDDESAWVESSLDPNRKVLSNPAISNLRSKIMKYRKERNEQLVPLLTAFTGLIGAIIGVVALFASK